MRNSLPPIVEKLIPRLASNFDGEVVATARAIDRALRANGRDWHDVARGGEPKPRPGGKLTQWVRCDRCDSETIAELQRYPSNNAVALRCLVCNRAIRQGGKLFVPHHELRALGIDPSTLPEVRDE
jgi:hypothetical protein